MSVPAAGVAGGFRRLDDGGRTVRLTIDGRDVAVEDRDTVASALLLAGLTACQANEASGEPRGPYCMMGVCFECLVTIDGVPDLQGCMIPARDGMRIETRLRPARGGTS